MIAQKKILVIDDSETYTTYMKRSLRKFGYDVLTASNPDESRESLVKGRFDMIFLDVRLKHYSGLELLEEIRPLTLSKIVIVTGFGTHDTIINAWRKGADDFLLKPHTLIDIKNCLDRNLVSVKKVKQEKSVKRKPIFLGEDKKFIEIKSFLGKISKIPGINILIVGESGVGKEVAARFIHEVKGSDLPFISINCGAISETLISSELFGHKKGAFTGASIPKEGVFRAAKNGVLLLDEIGELPLSLQPVLLRVIETKEIRPVGSDQVFSCQDLTIITATNSNLEEKVNCGKFRADLFFRLNTFSVEIPPLREHIKDLELLVNHILEKISKKRKTNMQFRISKTALNHLEQYSFPGNIRELYNILERATVLTKNNIIELEHLKLRKKVNSEGKNDVDNSSFEILKLKEKEVIINALEENNYNVTKTAKALGIKYFALRYRIKKLNIKIQK